MHIKNINIKRFRHLEDLRLGPFVEPDKASELICVAGPNGGGKSSILELVGFAISNTYSLSWVLNRSFPDASFEVEIGISDFEAGIVLESCRGQSDSDAKSYIRSQRSFWRGFNFLGSNYEADATLYNKVHQLVNTGLRKSLNRSMGFFLKSDRAYTNRKFDQKKLFTYDKIIEYDYILSMAYQSSEAQYQDMFDFLVQQRYHYYHRLGRYHADRDGGQTDKAAPTDPLAVYNELLGRLFPGYSFVHQEQTVPTNLFVRIPSGDVINFADLSSGEKEVFFVLSFFIRQSVEHAIVMIDEPEMHLHPELSRLFIRHMQREKPFNQIWVATHNPEIIDEAGSDRTVYIARDPTTRKAVVTSGADEEHSVSALRNLFGFSGYIGVGRKMVFLEGESTSTDKKLFSRLASTRFDHLKFVPLQSVSNVERLNRVVLEILEQNVGLVDYALIRDRDYMDSGEVQALVEKGKGRIFVLDRYHVENFLLEPKAIARVCQTITGKVTGEERVRRDLIAIVRGRSAQWTRDMAVAKLQNGYWREDMSIGNAYQAQSIFHDDGSINNNTVHSIAGLMKAKVESVNADIRTRTSGTVIENIIQKQACRLRDALDDPDDRGLKLVPGRTILEAYAKRLDVKPVTLINLVVQEMTSRDDNAPAALVELISCVAATN